MSPFTDFTQDTRTRLRSREESSAVKSIKGGSPSLAYAGRVSHPINDLYRSFRQGDVNAFAHGSYAARAGLTKQRGGEAIRPSEPFVLSYRMA